MALQSESFEATDDNVTWLNAFLDQEENSLFCRVNDSFLGDKFELYDLDGYISNYRVALNLIRNRNCNDYDQLSKERQEVVDHDAQMLYGLIHSRFIITKHGLNKMRDKYYLNDFGFCQRHNCLQQPLLPIGITDEINKETLRLYCSCCNDIYIPQNKCHRNIDGAYFGRTFAHLFLLSFPKLKSTQISSKEQYKEYIPKIFGFKMHDSWHQVALNALGGTHLDNIDNKDNDEKELIYLQSINKKQNEEILRLQQIIVKKEREIKQTKSINKTQSIQILSARTKINLLKQPTIVHDNSTKVYVKDTIVAAPLPNAIDNEEMKLDTEIGFQDILNALNKRVNIIKSKYKHNNTLKVYEKELNEICNLVNSLKSHLNTLQNGM